MLHLVLCYSSKHTWPTQPMSYAGVPIPFVLGCIAWGWYLKLDIEVQVLKQGPGFPWV